MSDPERVGGVRRERGIVGTHVPGTEQAHQFGGESTRNRHGDQRDALAFAGCTDSASRKMRVAPSRSCSIDVAYEMRM